MSCLVLYLIAMDKYTRSQSYASRLNYLLKAFGFQHAKAGKAYLNAAIPAYQRFLPNTAALISLLENEVITQSFYKAAVTPGPRKHDTEFTVSDFIDYVFCPYKVVLRFAGCLTLRSKETHDGSQFHSSEIFLEHIAAAKKVRSNIFKRIAGNFNSGFSPQYRDFLHTELSQAQILYSSEADQELLRCGNIRGKPDYIFRTPKGNLLVELKYSHNEQDMLFATYKIQAFCYWLLAQANDVSVDRACILKFSSDKQKLKQPRIYPFSIDPAAASATVQNVNAGLCRIVEAKPLNLTLPIDLKKCVRCGFRYICRYLRQAQAP